MSTPEYPEYTTLDVADGSDIRLLSLYSRDGSRMYRDMVCYNTEPFGEIDFPTESSAFQALVDDLIAQRDKGHLFAYSVNKVHENVDIADTIVPLGIIVLGRDQTNAKEAYVGYVLGGASINCGYATAAARVLTAYAFEDLGVESITVPSSEDNPASVRVAEKLGAQMIDGHYVLLLPNIAVEKGEDGR